MNRRPFGKFLEIIVLVCIASVGLFSGMLIGGRLLGRGSAGIDAPYGEKKETDVDAENAKDSESGDEGGQDAGSDTQTDTSAEEEAEAALELEFIDADEYFEENGQVLSVTEMSSSRDVQSEKEISEEFEARGFSQYPIFTEYSMDGSFYEAKEITSYSNQKHPQYMTYYVTTGGEVWTIISINGSIVANPLSYNMQADLSAPLIISETESVVSYDNQTGKFYETIPDDNVLIVQLTERIDSETLEFFVAWEVNRS